ncbi:MAG: ABC transporter permease [Prevotella sp.]|nr:ABC transporter permease [Prevotella sp.]
MSFPLFLARKIYASDADKNMVSRPAVRIATMGVAVGLAVMIISVCVVLGFKHTIRDKVIGFGSHITVADYMTMQTAEQYPIQMGDSMMRVLRGIEGVKHVQRYALKQGILKTDDDFLGVMLKGVGPDYDSTFIHKNLIAGRIPLFSEKKSQQKLVISQTMADKLKLKCGDRVFAYFINNEGVRTRRFSIEGIYQTNLQQYDESVCLTDIYTVNKLNGWEPDQYSGAELTVNNFNNLDETAHHIINKVNRTEDRYGGTYSAQTVTEMNPQIFSWLDLMDLNVWMILALMVAVAGVTMISGLLIIILERTQMIGILKALGSRNRQIRHTFLWLAVFIISKGLFIGNILGLGLIILQHYTGLVKLEPSKYYVATVPVELNIPFIIALNVATLVICILVLIAPSYLISHIHPAKSISYE